MDVTKRIEWLGRQPPGVFSPQAHEQAAKVYRAAGRTSDARAILIDKEKRLQEARGGASKVWHGLLGLLIAYGYKPWRVGWPIGGVIAVGWAFAWCAFDNGHMVPAKERIFMHTCYNTRTYPCSDWTATPLRDGRVLRLPADYTEFNSFVYAVDTFFPIVDLHQEDNWNPRSDGFWGGVYRAWLWLHIALGWFLTTIAVVGLTGIIKKEDK